MTNMNGQHSIRKASLTAFGFVSLFFCVEANAAEFDANLASLVPTSIKSAGLIKIASPQNVPPNIYLEGNVLKGEAVDLVRAIEPVLGVKFEFTDLQWPGVIPGIVSGNYDMSIGAMSYKPEREDVLDMIVYRANVSGVIVKNEDAESIKQASDLCGKTAAAVQASVLLQQLDQENIRCQKSGKSPIILKTFPNTTLAVTALNSDSADAYPASIGELIYTEEHSGGKLVARFFTSWQGNPQAVAVSKNLPGLADAIAGAIRNLHDTGEYQAILEKYRLGANGLEKDRIVVNPGHGAGGSKP